MLVVLTIGFILVPPSYSSLLGSYRCLAKNAFGQHDFSIRFQRPGPPDPPHQLRAVNVTHASFILTWQIPYNGGSNLIYHISLTGNRTEERRTSLNSIRFNGKYNIIIDLSIFVHNNLDLNEKSRYFVKIRSKNDLDFSDYSPSLLVLTSECPLNSNEFPTIQTAYYTTDGRRIHIQLDAFHSSLISKDQLCIQHYVIAVSRIETNDDMPPCVPLNLLERSNNKLEIQVDYSDIRLKICLINQTDVCSKSVSIPTGVLLSKDSSELILILTGKIDN